MRSSQRVAKTILFVAFGLAAGCSSTDSAPDAGLYDAAGGSDATSGPDFGPDLSVTDVTIFVDSENPAPDEGSGSNNSPLDGFGIITGECDVLDVELTSAEPSFVQNALDFGADPYDDADAARLTEGGREIIADGNAGGNSLLSEVFSYEMLARCEGAILLKTETEVTYTDSMGKITDLLVEIDGLKIGVSVTRALAFPFEDPYTEAQAAGLLADKLSDILLSTANVAAGDAWTKQILHVLAYSPMHADSLRAAYATLEPAVLADTVLLVTVTDGDDAPLY